MRQLHESVMMVVDVATPEDQQPIEDDGVGPD